MGRTVNVPRAAWSAAQTREARKIIAGLLAGLGDPSKERGFGMEVTMCAHRVTTPAERSACDLDGERAAHLAGSGFVELWRTPDYPATSPSLLRCEQGKVAWLDVPTRRIVSTPAQGRIKVPADCGECGSCRARAEAEA